jgi:hypothetical protein
MKTWSHSKYYAEVLSGSRILILITWTRFHGVSRFGSKLVRYCHIGVPKNEYLTSAAQIHQWWKGHGSHKTTDERATSNEKLQEYWEISHKLPMLSLEDISQTFYNSEILWNIMNEIESNLVETESIKFVPRVSSAFLGYIVQHWRTRFCEIGPDKTLQHSTKILGESQIWSQSIGKLTNLHVLLLLNWRPGQFRDIFKIIWKFLQSADLNFITNVYLRSDGYPVLDFDFTWIEKLLRQRLLVESDKSNCWNLSQQIQFGTIVHDLQSSELYPDSKAAWRNYNMISAGIDIEWIR